MPNYNKVLLMGNLTTEPRLQVLSNKTALVNFYLASNRVYRKQDGAEGKETCFVDCTMFGKSAEVLAKYVKKGDPIFVEGRLKFDQWKDKDGNDQRKLGVLVESFQFLKFRQSEPSQPEPGEDLPF